MYRHIRHPVSKESNANEEILKNRVVGILIWGNNYLLEMIVQQLSVP
jgi:hypothetical protein